MVASAASAPLLPCLTPDRSMAWSTVSQVSTPKPIGSSNSQADAIQPRRAFAADVVEMRRGAADHHAERDEAVVLARTREPLGGQRQLEGAGHPDEIDRGIGDPVPLQRVEGAANEVLDDPVIEAGGKDAEFRVPECELSFERCAWVPGERGDPTRGRRRTLLPPARSRKWRASASARSGRACG